MNAYTSDPLPAPFLARFVSADAVMNQLREWAWELEPCTLTKTSTYIATSPTVEDAVRELVDEEDHREEYYREHGIRPCACGEQLVDVTEWYCGKYCRAQARANRED